MSYHVVNGMVRRGARPRAWNPRHENQPAERWDYRRGLVSAARDRAYIAAANRMRWLEISRSNTIGERARIVKEMCAVGVDSFRLVNVHGHSHGRRYTATGEARRYGPAGFREFLAHDSRGNAVWFDRHVRVRIVARQEEDFHSRISRMLAAAHRSAS